MRTLWPEGPDELRQKRYVVYGVGGSGKTQFCCKYAQDHRERHVHYSIIHTVSCTNIGCRYWGIFWVDGREEQRLKQSFAQNIAKLVGVGKTYQAALHWLSHLDEDWLLIIDNADDPDIDLVKFFPQGANGHVLITTRNQDCSFGNVGSVAFDGMRPEDANKLLIHVAQVSQSPDNESIVGDIVHHLGFLALAIVVAGSAIRQGACLLKEYLHRFNAAWSNRRPNRNAAAGIFSPENERFVNHLRSAI